MASPSGHLIQKTFNFTPGWVTAYPASLIPDGAASDVSNVDFTENLGTITKRQGSAITQAELAGLAFPYVSGLTQFILANGTTFTVAASTDDVYSVAAGVWTSMYANANLNGLEVNFATFKNLLIFVASVIPTQKWTGAGASENLLGTPPANAKYIEVHKGRVWIANSSAGKSRLHYSKLDDPEDWTATGDTGAGFIDINPDDGGEITGIVSVSEVLVVFKRHSVYLVRGHKPSTFSTTPLGGFVGCVANRSICKAEGFAIFLSDYGIYSVSSDGLALLSRNIQPTVDALTSTQRLGVAGGKYRNQYWLAYDTNADGNNDTALVLDYVYGIWSKYGNIKARVFLTDNTGVMYSGGSDKTIIRQHNTGTEDEATAVTMTWTSKDYDFGSSCLDKQGKALWVDASPISGKTIKIDHYVTGVDQSDTVTLTLTPTSTETHFLDSFNLKQASQGRYLRLKLTQDQTAARIIVYGFELHAEVRAYRD